MIAQICVCAGMIGDEWSDDDATFWKHLGQNQDLIFFTIFTSSCSAPECLLELTIRSLRFDCTFTEVTWNAQEAAVLHLPFSSTVKDS